MLEQTKVPRCQEFIVFAPTKFVRGRWGVLLENLVYIDKSRTQELSTPCTSILSDYWSTGHGQKLEMEVYETLRVYILQKSGFRVTEQCLHTQEFGGRPWQLLNPQSIPQSYWSQLRLKTCWRARKLHISVFDRWTSAIQWVEHRSVCWELFSAFAQYIQYIGCGNWKGGKELSTSTYDKYKSILLVSSLDSPQLRLNRNVPLWVEL